MAVDTTDPRYLLALRCALLNMAGAEARWAALSARGATDEELTAQLSYELGIWGSSSGSGWLHEEHRGNPPRVWISDRHIMPLDKPDYHGARLLALVRQLFGIAKPGGAVQPSLFGAGIGGPA